MPPKRCQDRRNPTRLSLGDGPSTHRWLENQNSQEKVYVIDHCSKKPSNLQPDEANLPVTVQTQQRWSRLTIPTRRGEAQEEGGHACPEAGVGR